MSVTGKRAITVGATTVLCALYSVFYSQHSVGLTRPDYDQIWGAGRALISGLDPYQAIGPNRWFPFHYPLYYPLTAAIAFLPLAFVPLIAARAIFAALCGGAFALAITKGNRFERTPALLSFSMLAALQWGQIAPLLGAALVYPWLGGLVAVKPTSGLAAVAAQRRGRDVVVALAVAAAITVISLVLAPAWPGRWLATLHDIPHLVPMVARWGGVVLLLAVVRWRRAEARWLFTIALVPTTSPLYESLPLFLAPLSFRQSLSLALLSHVAGWSTLILVDHTLPLVTQYARSATITIFILYLPALVVMLRSASVLSLPEHREDRESRGPVGADA